MSGQSIADNRNAFFTFVTNLFRIENNTAHATNAEMV